jgi:osmotically-inducible protein OsmY
MMRTDEEIKKDVVDHLYWDDGVDASDVKVEVTAGKVRLTGTLASYTARAAAASLAWSVRGVTGVTNLLSIRLPPTFTVPTDEQLQTGAKNALAWNPDVYGFDIDVSVADGIVTLKGTVDTYWKRYTAENVVSQLSGVADVVNQLAVVPTQKQDDKLIAQDIEASLERNLYVNAEDVTVKVENGEVILTGTVPTWHARGNAYHAAAFTLGVRDVQNYLTVG